MFRAARLLAEYGSGIRLAESVLVVLVVVLVVLVVAFVVVVVASHYYYKESHHQDHQNHHQDHQKSPKDKCCGDKCCQWASDSINLQGQLEKHISTTEVALILSPCP